MATAVRPVTTLARAPPALWSFHLAADRPPVFLQPSPLNRLKPPALHSATGLMDFRLPESCAGHIFPTKTRFCDLTKEFRLICDFRPWKGAIKIGKLNHSWGHTDQLPSWEKKGGDLRDVSAELQGVLPQRAEVLPLPSPGGGAGETSFFLDDPSMPGPLHVTL